MKHFHNYSHSNSIFTARLVDEIAKMMENSDILFISFPDIIAKMRGTSRPERLPEYALNPGDIAARPYRQSRTQARQDNKGSRYSRCFKLSTSDSATSELVVTTVFKAHIQDVKIARALR
jgi:hypothetical protein